MASETGRAEAVLTEAVLADLARANFEHAMTVVDRVLPVDAHAGRTPDPREERVRFRANPNLAFVPGDMERIEWAPGEPPLLEVTVNFLGLHGPSSPLPPHYAETIAKSREAVDTVRDFFDFFNHRFVSFLRRIWLRWRYHLRYRPGGGDPISRRILCLAGIPLEDDGITAAGERPLLLPEVGLLALSARSGAVIETVLRDRFGVPFEIVEFVRREVEIPPDARSKLGTASAVLGRNLVAGRRVSDSLGKYRVRAGPLSRQQFLDLLPDGALHVPLCRLVELMQDQPLDWDLELVLLPGEARPFRLGAGRLGHTTWLDGVPAEVAPVLVRPAVTAETEAVAAA